jgi:hypothetical protein
MPSKFEIAQEMIDEYSRVKKPSFLVTRRVFVVGRNISLDDHNDMETAVKSGEIVPEFSLLFRLFMKAPVINRLLKRVGEEFIYVSQGKEAGTLLDTYAKVNEKIKKREIPQEEVTVFEAPKKYLELS